MEDMNGFDVEDFFEEIDVEGFQEFVEIDDESGYEYEGKEDFSMPSPDSDIGVVIVLGNMPSESIVTSVKSSNRVYITKLFKSTPVNWRKMTDIIHTYGEKSSTQVICQLTEDTLLTSCQPDYIDIYNELIDALSQTRHLILMYHSNLVGEFNWIDNRHYLRRFNNDLSRVKEAIQGQVSMLLQKELNIAPYRTRVDFCMSAQSFLNEGRSGLLLRLYVPNEKLFGKELDQLLTMFRDYLTKVANITVTLQQNHSQHGISYNFYTDHSGDSIENWQQSLSDFTQFLSLCATNPRLAQDILEKNKIAKNTASDLVTRYARDSRRIYIDLEYENNRAFNEIEHRLKSELLDIASGENNEAIIQQVLNQTRPIFDPSKQLVNTLSIPPIELGSNVIQTFNIKNINNAQFVNTANGIIANVVQGDINYTDIDKSILELIREATTDTQTLELKSALDELKDQTAPQNERLSAWQKLYTFIIRHKDKVENIVTEVMAKYIENVLSGKI